MARKPQKKKTKSGQGTARARYTPAALYRRLRRFVLRGVLAMLAGVFALVLLFSVVNPPITHTIWSEYRRLGEVDREWVPIEHIAPVMARSVVASEDAQFCTHWGFDVQAIRAALEAGAQRGASTLTQQVVKNVFLWQGRSWFRKAMETFLTPIVEAVWSKRRILEVYLNVAEMGEGIFGVDAAAWHYFNVGPDALTAGQAALIAALLPNPKQRSASDPSGFMRKRAKQIIDGAATIERDGRATCFED